jgi:hypothetical protein
MPPASPPDPDAVRTRMWRSLNRLAKWRTLFAGWQLGTRPASDPVAQAVKDHREATLLLRVEVTALTGLLLAKGLVTEVEWLTAVADEADSLNTDLEQRFPGVKAHDDGLTLDRRVMPWMKGWPE